MIEQLNALSPEDLSVVKTHAEQENYRVMPDNELSYMYGDYERIFRAEKQFHNKFIEYQWNEEDWYDGEAPTEVQTIIRNLQKAMLYALQEPAAYVISEFFDYPKGAGILPHDDAMCGGAGPMQKYGAAFYLCDFNAGGEVTGIMNGGEISQFPVENAYRIFEPGEVHEVRPTQDKGRKTIQTFIAPMQDDGTLHTHWTNQYGTFELAAQKCSYEIPEKNI